MSCKRSTKKFVAKLSGDVIEEITKGLFGGEGGGMSRYTTANIVSDDSHDSYDTY